MIRLLAPAVVPAADALRPPSPIDLLAHAYKDWLHLNVFDAASGAVAIVNASLHGDPLSPSSLGVGTFIVHRAAAGGGPAAPLTVAAVEVRARSLVDVTSTSIGIGRTARIALGGEAFLTASARAEGAALDVLASPEAPAITVEAPVPFGAGWIAWRAVPRLTVEGRLRVGRWEVDLGSAVGYHDHNWGRWRWGDDIGWRWGTFPVVGDPVTVVVAHRTNRRHRSGWPIARVQAGPARRDYPERTVRVEYAGRHERPVRRLPGAMAALRSDRQRPDLPARVVTRIVDGRDRLDVEFLVDEAVQLVTAEPSRPGHTFIHELVGRFELSGHAGGRALAGTGLGVFEHVD